MRLAETTWNTLKGGRTEKRGGGNKDYKKGGRLCQRVGALKRGAGAPFQIVVDQTVKYGEAMKVLFYLFIQKKKKKWN